MQDHGFESLRLLLATLPGAVVETHAQHGDATAVVAPEELLRVMHLLREAPELEFDLLSDVTAVDYLGREPRFEVVYHLYSLPRNQRVRIKTRVREDACE